MDEIVSTLGLQDKLQNLLSNLSGGQQRFYCAGSAHQAGDHIGRKIREVLHLPELAAEIAANRPQPVPVVHNAKIERRIREIDRSIARFMELYQHDNIPAEILGDSINKLYTEKTALQNSPTPEPKSKVLLFDLAQELIADAAEIWDFVGDEQKRRIMQSLIPRIVLTNDDVKIKWVF